MATGPLVAALVFAGTTSTANGSLTLERALDLAREHHESIPIAQAQVERAAAIRKMAVSALLPEVSVEGSYTRQPERSVNFGGGVSQVVQENDVLMARASANVTLLEAKNFAVLRRAEPTFAAVEARAKEVSRQLGFEVAQTFLAVLSAERLADAANRRIALATKAQTDANKRFQHGLVGGNDVTRADLELSRAELTANDSEATVDELRLRLERYVGEAGGWSLVSSPDLEIPSTATETELIARAHEERLDLAALKNEAEAARLAANEPYWDLLPTLSLDASVDLTTQEGFTGQNNNTVLTLSAKWVLYDRGRRYREAEARAAAAREAALLLQRAQKDAENEIKRGLVQLDRGRLARARAETRAKLSRKNAEEVAVRYREGVASAFELADANVQDFEAQAELARAQFDLALSILALRKVTGSGAL